MPPNTDDLRIRSFAPLSTPAELLRELPCSDAMSDTVATARRALHRILHGEDDRLAVVIGPCSIHDKRAGLEYAKRLRPLRDTLGDALEIVMRVYFEKPRTTIGWKGLINDPDLDGSFNINKGLRLGRGLLCDINALGLPAGVEYLDTISPQYISDLVAWGAIGARTTESQVHRELASGLSCPVGFKNGTDGNVKIAVDAVGAASHPHHFLAVTKEGQATVAATTGNPDGHVILRGGKTPNYGAEHVAAACKLLEHAGLSPRLMVDASHANSGKRPENQPLVVADVAAQLEAGERRIVGVMVESHLVAGRQDLVPGRPLVYGQSITDACIDWPASVAVLERLAAAVRRRRGGRLTAAASGR
jgi:3-deoxy-7-phosphoheptulonate synthase